MASNQYVRHDDGIGPWSALEERTVTDQDPSHVLAILDRQQTLSRYLAAATALEAAKEQEDGWRQFDFPELPGELEQSSDVDSRRRIDSAFYSWREKFKDQTAWRKGSYAVQCIRGVCTGWLWNSWWAEGKREQLVGVLCLSWLT